jgi:hypothetical protein
MLNNCLQNAEEDAGRIGLVMVLAGIVGSILGGVILDKTHRFKYVPSTEMSTISATPCSSHAESNLGNGNLVAHLIW